MEAELKTEQNLPYTHTFLATSAKSNLISNLFSKFHNKYIHSFLHIPTKR